MENYYKGIYDAYYKTEYSDVDDACVNISDSPCSAFADEITDVVKQLNDALNNITGWKDSNGVLFRDTCEGIIDRFSNISNNIQDLFAKGEQAYRDFLKIKVTTL